jgi:GNAT superfamily N-acetyltransferase
MTVQLIVRPPKSFTPEERSAFVELVKKDPQVNKNTLPKLVDDAYLLVFLYIDGILVGTNAVKNNPDYWMDLEDNSGVTLDSTEYLGEIGYMHVAEAHRGAGLGKLLELATIAAAKGKGLFCTIQSKNLPSRRLVEGFGFKQVGKSWPSKEAKGDVVNLYLRPGKP